MLQEFLFFVTYFNIQSIIKKNRLFSLQNRGIYMFRLDEDRVIDATLCGGLARYINHSCSPNCTTEIVEVDRDLRIIIFAKRRISRGEEVSEYSLQCLKFSTNILIWI